MGMPNVLPKPRWTVNWLDRLAANNTTKARRRIKAGASPADAESMPTVDDWDQGIDSHRSYDHDDMRPVSLLRALVRHQSGQIDSSHSGNAGTTFAIQFRDVPLSFFEYRPVIDCLAARHRRSGDQDERVLLLLRWPNTGRLRNHLRQRIRNRAHPCQFRQLARHHQPIGPWRDQLGR